MRYDPVTPPLGTNKCGYRQHQPVSILQRRDRDLAMNTRTAELDIWEDEGGTTASDAPEVTRANV
jgi:hypothetical protein